MAATTPTPRTRTGKPPPCKAKSFTSRAASGHCERPSALRFSLASIEDAPLEWYSTRDTRAPKVQRFEYPKGQRGYTPFVRAAVRASAGLEEAPITPEEGLHVLETIFAFY